MHVEVHESSSIVRRHLLVVGRKLSNRFNATSYSKSKNKRLEMAKIINIGLQKTGKNAVVR